MENVVIDDVVSISSIFITFNTRSTVRAPHMINRYSIIVYTAAVSATIAGAGDFHRAIISVIIGGGGGGVNRATGGDPVADGVGDPLALDVGYPLPGRIRTAGSGRRLRGVTPGAGGGLGHRPVAVHRHRSGGRSG